MESSDQKRRSRAQNRLFRLVGSLIVVSVLAAGCGAAEDTRPVSLALTDEVSTTVRPPTPSTTTTRAPTTTVSSTIAPDPLRTWVATAKPEITHLVAFDEPDGSVIDFEFLVPNPHQFEGPLTLMVVDGQPGDEWVQVQLPIRPNSQVGWIDASGYDIDGTRVRAEVVLSEHRVTVYDGEDVIAETQAVIGTSSTPTPLGTFFIAAKRRNPQDEAYLGPWALALSAYSEVYDTFDGGIPVIAIHGTTNPEQVGQSRSNGCIRVPNDVINFLAEYVPLGAPVTISG